MNRFRINILKGKAEALEPVKYEVGGKKHGTPQINEMQSVEKNKQFRFKHRFAGHEATKTRAQSTGEKCTN